MTARDDQTLRNIAAQLRGLLETSPRAESTVETWTEHANVVYAGLQRDFPEVRLPIQVMHFVHDGDIRARDPDYRQRQERVMRGLISALEQGTVPQRSGLTLTFTTRGLAISVFILAVVIVLLVSSRCSLAR